MDINEIATFALLVGLELVLGIDNILLITILTARLPEKTREMARRIGLAAALVGRILLLLFVTALQELRAPVVAGLSGRDLILLAGGIFLLYKSVKEIHHVVEDVDSREEAAQTSNASFSSIVVQVVLLDIVFSIDSIITAVGLTENLWTIVAAVLLSFAAVIAFAKPIGEFVNTHPALKILALSFLICIGVTLFLEGLHKEVPKGYIYLPMGFALGVELLQMRHAHNRKRA